MTFRGIALSTVAAGVFASGALAGSDAAPGRIVISADRLPSISGEIYRVRLDGKQTDLSNSPFVDTQPVVSPDGKRVAFISDRTGRAAIYVVGLDGHGLQQISSTFDQPTIVGWSPDSREVAIRVTGLVTLGSPGSELLSRLYVLAPGRRQRAIASEPDGQGCGLTGAAWSPAAPLIAFSSCTDKKSSVRVVTASGQSVDKAIDSADPASLVWSPTGQLATISDRSIRVFDGQGRQLARFAGDGLAWSRSGGRLASMAGGVLEVRNGGGAGHVALRKRLFPANRIRTIIARYDSYNPELLWVGGTRIAVGNAGTTTQMSVPPGVAVSPYATVDAGVDLASGRNWQPTKQAWFAGSCRCASPDGSLIASTKKAGDSFALRVSTPAGASARTIATVPGCLNDGSFLAAVDGIQFANGKQSVVYQSACYEPSANLYVLASGKLQRLTETNAQQTDPAWSPDGTRISYGQADAVGSSCKGCPEAIWVMNADGSSAHAVTTPLDLTFDASPSWSPDATQIVFSRSTTATIAHLFVVPVAGGAVRDLHLAGDDPAWGPSRIAYLGGFDVGGLHIQLKTMAPDGSDPRTLATGYLLSPAWSRDGRLAYLEQPPNGGKPDVGVIAGATTHRYPLALAEARTVRWSADATQLLVVGRAAANGPFDVFSIGADGQGLQPVTTNLDALGADAG